MGSRRALSRVCDSMRFLDRSQPPLALGEDTSVHHRAAEPQAPRTRHGKDAIWFEYHPSQRCLYSTAARWRRCCGAEKPRGKHDENTKRIRREHDENTSTSREQQASRCLASRLQVAQGGFSRPFCILHSAFYIRLGVAFPWRWPRYGPAQREDVWNCCAGINFTGPSSPESNSGSLFFHRCHIEKVNRPVGLGLPSSSHCGQRLSVPSGLRSLSSGNCSSPISRFGQRLTTVTSMVFRPARAASVTSRR